VDSQITYFDNSTDLMDYPTYRANGWRVSSGGVESADYHVTGARLEAQGMCWSEKGAAEMARLRADLANDVWRSRTRDNAVHLRSPVRFGTGFPEVVVGRFRA